MTDIALTEWEHQPHVLNVLISREMGAWLGRRDSRLLQEIRQEIEECPSMDCGWGYSMSKNRIISIIDKHIKEIEDMGDYPDEIPNQFDNMTGSMNL